MSTIVGVTEPFQVIIPLLYAVIAVFFSSALNSSHLLTQYCSPHTLYLLHTTLILLLAYLQIQLPTSGPDNSSSDSSDFSSEDDSTVVLMKTRSQSPSPRRSKHRSHHSRSGSSSPEQAKVKAPSQADGSPSSAAETAERESSGCPVEGSSSQASDPQEQQKDRRESGL